MKNPGLEKLNQLTAAEAQAEFLRCCGSAKWAARMTELRPYASPDLVYAAASQVWRTLSRTDWLEAFGHHPRIGESALRERFAATADLAREEQKGVDGASERVINALARENAAYEARFGHVFLVCATGKTADEMLGLLRRRIGNDPETELRVAAGEQDKITRIRLEKVFKS